MKKTLVNIARENLTKLLSKDIIVRSAINLCVTNVRLIQGNWLNRIRQITGFVTFVTRNYRIINWNKIR